MTRYLPETKVQIINKKSLHFGKIGKIKFAINDSTFGQVYNVELDDKVIQFQEGELLGMEE